MDFGLKGRKAVITGGYQGIGKAVALSLANEGCNVILIGLDAARLREAAKDAQKFGVEAKWAAVDATKQDEVGAFYQKHAAEAGNLDILVNNIGGITKHAKFDDLSDDDFYKSFELNFMSAVRFTRGALPYLKKSNQARIINIATVPARQPGEFDTHYGSLKAALLNFTKYMSNQLAKDNILVNAICPSAVKGETWERDIADRAQRENINIKEAEQRIIEEIKKKVPLGRLADPEDIASLAVFLASRQAGFITGTCVSVDGGMMRSIF